MSSTPMEKRLFRRSFDDGWLDVLVGLGLTGIGVCWLAGAIALTAVVPAVLFPFWKIGREALVEPRLGRVRFSEARTEETRRSLTGWLVLGASVLVAEAAVEGSTIIGSPDASGGTLSSSTVGRRSRIHTRQGRRACVRV